MILTNRELFWRGDTGYLAIVLAAASLLGAPIILFGLPHGHSLIENLLWSQEFARQLLAEDLYPDGWATLPVLPAAPSSISMDHFLSTCPHLSLRFARRARRLFRSHSLSASCSQLPALHSSS